MEEKVSPSFAIEDWKVEQLQDIKIINEYEEEYVEPEQINDEVVQQENLIETTNEIISASELTDLTSTNLP